MTLQEGVTAELDQSAAVAALQTTVLQFDTVLSIGGGGEAEIVAPGGLVAANSIGGAGQPDLVVGGLDGSSSGDDGVIASEPSLPGSDLIFQTNDAFAIELDRDGSGEDADFIIRDKDNNEIFDVEEDGQVRLHGATSMTAGDDPTFGPVLSFIGETSDQVESGRIRFREGTSSTNLRGGYMHYDGSANKMHIGVHDTSDNDLVNDEDIITIERVSGQVGIGTTSPDRELTVNDTNGSGGASINVTAPNRELLMAVNQSSGGIVGTLTDTDLQLRTNNANRLVIDNAGDVEVREDLEVFGDVRKRFAGTPASIAPFAMAIVEDDSTISGDNGVFTYKTANIGSISRVSVGNGQYAIEIDGPCPFPTGARDQIGFVNVRGEHESASVAEGCSGIGQRFLYVTIRDSFGNFIDGDFEVIVFGLF